MTLIDGRRAPASIEEIGDRIRRIETRITAYLTSIGFDTQVQLPVWCDDNSISIPSMRCAIEDILAAIPMGHDGAEIEVHHKSNHVAYLISGQGEPT